MPVKIIQASINGLPDRMYLKDGKVFFMRLRQKTANLETYKYRIEQLRKKDFIVLCFMHLLTLTFVNIFVLYFM